VTPKGERTRQHIIDVAMERFERDGFAATSMRAIAADAGVAQGLAYRYFEAKEAIVLAFYQQVARDLAAQPIEGDTLGSRFRSVMRAKISLLAHRRRAMGSVLAAMLDPDGPVGLLSPATAEIRQTTRAVLRQAIQGAPGLPEHLHEPLVRLGWVGHALLTLAWVQRPDATLDLLDKVAWALDRCVPLLALPQAGAALAAASEALARFGDDEGDGAVVDRAPGE
jgi:AcrR family transcriptional regulator